MAANRLNINRFKFPYSHKHANKIFRWTFHKSTTKPFCILLLLCWKCIHVLIVRLQCWRDYGRRHVLMRIAYKKREGRGGGGGEWVSREGWEDGLHGELDRYSSNVLLFKCWFQETSRLPRANFSSRWSGQWGSCLKINSLLQVVKSIPSTIYTNKIVICCGLGGLRHFFPNRITSTKILWPLIG